MWLLSGLSDQSVWRNTVANAPTELTNEDEIRDYLNNF